MRAYSFRCERRAPRHFFSQGIEVHLRWKRRSVGLVSRIRYMPKSLRISSGDGCFTWKKPAVLSTFTTIDLKGCTSLGHPRDASLWLFGNHPLNRRHVRTIEERQGDQVVYSLWMSWIERTVKWLANKYIDKNNYWKQKNFKHDLWLARTLLSEVWNCQANADWENCAIMIFFLLLFWIVL